ncbi:Integrase [Theobroma cacao]|nr:Integrase [Theobroma cacao]
MYVVFLEDLEINSEICLIANAENDSWLWHRRLGHVSLHTMSKLIRKNLVVGLSDLKFENEKICDACQLGKQVRTSFKTKKIVSTPRPLELLHIDLFGPISTTSLGGKSYGFLIVDDYSRYTWVYFLAHKNDALSASISHCRKVENEKGLAIVSIRSDHGGEFENFEFEEFFNEKGLDHNFSAPRTPQQNGVVETKNQTLKEMARTMLCENNLPKYFWAEVVNTVAYILNRVSIRPMISKTPYELYKGRKPNISHLRSFGCKCFVLNNRKQPLGKFDAKSDEAIFLGYALNSKVYSGFNKRTLNVEKSIHVVFDESNDLLKEIRVDDDDIEILEKQMEEMSLENNKNSEESSTRRENETPSLEDLQRTENQHNDLPRSWRFVRDHLQDQIISDISQGVRTRRTTRETCEFSTFI